MSSFEASGAFEFADTIWAFVKAVCSGLWTALRWIYRGLAMLAPLVIVYGVYNGGALESRFQIIMFSGLVLIYAVLRQNGTFQAIQLSLTTLLAAHSGLDTAGEPAESTEAGRQRIVRNTITDWLLSVYAITKLLSAGWWG